MKCCLLLLLLFCLVAESYSQKYVKVWSDEFNTPGLPDSTKWDFLNQKGYNDELQYYTKKESKNAWIQDTTLIIELRKEPYLTANYTSAMLVSKMKGDWLYGKMDIRAKVPTGKGTWPAIWMMPTNNEYGGGAKSGEIDIMEYVGMNANNLYYTSHFQGTGTSGQESSGTYNVIYQPYNKFITFSLIWTPTKLEWYADGVKTYTYAKPLNADYRTWPFDKLFYMILNLSYGGSWGGQQGIDDTKLPHKFYIDYVRVYQMQESTGPFSIKVEPSTYGSVEISPRMDSYPEGTQVTATAKPNDKYEFQKWLYVGSANPMQLTVTKEIHLIPVFKKKNELIINGDFSLGLINWNYLYFQNATTMAATPSIVDGVYVMNVTKPGTATWHICDQQSDLSVEKDATYLVTFDAKADMPGTLEVYLAKNYDDYGYYYSTMKSLTKTMKHFTWSFKMLQASDPKCRFGFGFGKFTGKVYLDNVSIEKQVLTRLEESVVPNKTFELFPNPADDFIDITNRSGKPMQPTLQLYNLQGQLISTLLYHQPMAAGEKVRIHLKKCMPPNGIYLINISTAEKSYTQKLLIHRP